MLFERWDEAEVEMGCGVQFNALYSTDNRYLLDVAEQYPERVSPVVILWPTDPATPAALRSMAKAYGIGGVRFSGLPDRSEERRVGKACVSTCRSRWSPYH